MYKNCKTEQSAARQRALEQGLLEMMTKQKYDEISVSDLCDYLQIPRKSFYRYFSSKDGALHALLDHTMLEFYKKDYKKSDGISHLGDLKQFFVFWYDHRDLLAVLHSSNMSGLLVERAASLAMRERIMPAYLRDKTADVQMLALAFSVCGLMSMVLQWYHQDYITPPEEMSRIAAMLLTKPLIIL